MPFHDTPPPSKRRPRLPRNVCGILECDNASLSLAAVDYFRARGFANFAFVGFAQETSWSNARQSAFVQYFCARPRRFGKSLAISTLQCIFEGRRDLFRGLAIDTSDYDWTTYPVLRLDMGNMQYPDVAGLKAALVVCLHNEAARLGVEARASDDPIILFDNLIKEDPVLDERLRISETFLSASFEPEQVGMLPLMYYTGYLTIKETERDGYETVYTLGYPNLEVSLSMNLT